MGNQDNHLQSDGIANATLYPSMRSWITSLAQSTRNVQQNPESRIRTMISCDRLAGKRTIYIPADMTELQPDSLRYLQSFAELNDLQLVEDRRRHHVQPLLEQRNTLSPDIAKAIGELLQQLGMPGAKRSRSKPHRLSADSQHINIKTLIRMAAIAAPKAKRILVKPKRRLINVLDGNNEPLVAYGSKMVSASTSSVLSHFDSPHFRALGYSAGKQYVVHVCVAGGPLKKPELWAQFHTLTRTDFQFQLFNSENTEDSLGLIYATFYLDLSDSPAPWWLNNWSNSQLTSLIDDDITLLQQAG